ncbi:MAG: dephospho-CoA kinase [Gemmataceae bacterium]|nr:dephospho-CoA kinase [Gemmataceae bacterium]
MSAVMMPSFDKNWTVGRKPVIGLVGGIGAGKSAAADALARHGGRVIAADPVGHAALLDPEIRRRVAGRWPASVGADGQIDRKLLGRAVFADPDQRKELEAIVFPWIHEELQSQIAAARKDSAVRYVILDAAVILESGWTDICDRMIFVDTPRALRLARVANRGWSAAELDRREQAQWSLDRKRAVCDAVLPNAGTLDYLQQAADELLNRWGLPGQS